MNRVEENTVSSDSYSDIYLKFDSISNLSTKFYDKQDHFNLKLMNVLHLSSNIQTSTEYVLYMSNLIQYPRAYSYYKDFVKHHRCLSKTKIYQGNEHNIFHTASYKDPCDKMKLQLQLFFLYLLLT